jgi:methylthioribose-1-phosphate isomerase
MPGESAAYRSPYRLVDDGLILIDQRELPGAIVELTCRDGRDVARAMASGAARGAPLLGQLAAYAMALTARRHRQRHRGALEMELRSTEEQLRRTRPTARPVRYALERMAARRARLTEDVDPEVLSDALRAEADAMADEATMDHAALARHGAAALPQPDDRPLELLVHGETGAMGGGLLGTGLAIVQLLAAQDRPVHVWVTETGPGLEGARITAWELRQAGVPHTVLPDTAVTWLLQRHAPDAALLGAEWLTASGDAAVVAGGGGIAALASTLVEPPVPVLLCAPFTTFDPEAPDATALPDELGPPRESHDVGASRQPTASRIRIPMTDVAEARWLTGIATEEGVLPAPFPSALRTALAAREARRARSG